MGFEARAVDVSNVRESLNGDLGQFRKAVLDEIMEEQYDCSGFKLPDRASEADEAENPLREIFDAKKTGEVDDDSNLSFLETRIRPESERIADAILEEGLKINSDTGRILDNAAGLRYIVGGEESLDHLVDEINEKLAGRGFELRVQDYPTVRKVVQSTAELVGREVPDMVKVVELVNGEGDVVGQTVVTTTNPFK